MSAAVQQILLEKDPLGRHEPVPMTAEELEALYEAGAEDGKPRLEKRGTGWVLTRRGQDFPVASHELGLELLEAFQ